MTQLPESKCTECVPSCLFLSMQMCMAFSSSFSSRKEEPIWLRGEKVICSLSFSSSFYSFLAPILFPLLFFISFSICWCTSGVELRKAASHSSFSFFLSIQCKFSNTRVGITDYDVSLESISASLTGSLSNESAPHMRLLVCRLSRTHTHTRALLIQWIRRPTVYSPDGPSRPAFSKF